MNLERTPAQYPSTARVIEDPKKANTLELHGETAEDLYNTIRSHPEQTAAVQDILKGFLGAVLAKDLVEQPEFFENMIQLKAKLRQPYKEGSPPYIANANFLDALAIHEALGDDFERLLQAMDVQEYLPDLVFDKDSKEAGQIFQFDKRPTVDKYTGRLARIKVGIKLRYRTKPTNSLVTLQRTLHHARLGNTADEQDAYRTIQHDTFSLPDHLQGDGVAAQLLERSLEEYDRLNVRVISLCANIDVGSYAWATYGFGWDETYEGEKESVINKVRKQIYDTLAQCKLLSDNGPDATALDSAYTEQVEVIIEQLRQAATPQDLALIGERGPFFCRDRNGTWYTFPTKEEANTKLQALRSEVDEWDETMESDEHRGVQHAGKIGLHKNQWHGILELKADGPQQGENRKLFTQALARRRAAASNKRYAKTKN